MIRPLLTRYIAEHGLLSFVAECLAMLTVFVLLGGVWIATPAAATAPATSPPVADGAGRGVAQ